MTRGNIVDMSSANYESITQEDRDDGTSSPEGRRYATDFVAYRPPIAADFIFGVVDADVRAR